MPPNDIKTRLRAAMTTLHEEPIDLPTWGLTGALLREFTARERQYAQEAIQTEAGEADVDQVLFRAMLLQRCITDPATGRPYTDGRAGPNGQPLIDPRTRSPIFSIEDIQELADSRALLFNMLWDKLIALAAAAPISLFPGDRADERAERDAGAGDGGDAAGASEPTDQGTGDADGGSEVSGDIEQRAGDTPG